MSEQFEELKVSTLPYDYIAWGSLVALAVGVLVWLVRAGRRPTVTETTESRTWRTWPER